MPELRYLRPEQLKQGNSRKHLSYTMLLQGVTVTILGLQSSDRADRFIEGCSCLDFNLILEMDGSEGHRIRRHCRARKTSSEGRVRSSGLLRSSDAIRGFGPQHYGYDLGIGLPQISTSETSSFTACSGMSDFPSSPSAVLRYAPILHTAATQL